jgi:PleD family two-component response regulator
MPFEYMDAKATISCRISEFPADGNARQELISMAGKALYYAKQTGRNQVVIWQNELTKQFVEK